MLTHPNIDPVVLQIGPLALYWYGLTYSVAFLLFIWLGKRHARLDGSWDQAMVERIMLYGLFGVILGGRFGYVLFYRWIFYMNHPLKILALWEGGMSFHGGLIGVLIAMGLLAYRTHYSFWQITDFVAPLIPPGLAAGRIGNFINGELWGKVTTSNLPWVMGFPKARYADYLYAIHHTKWLNFFRLYHTLPRHPSQLYECLFEGILLFILLHFYRKKQKKLGKVSGMFLVCYGAIRYTIEFFREPDAFMPSLLWGLSMGQWLSIPMILIGLMLLIYPFAKPTSGN